METTQENNELVLEELKQNTDISNTERTAMYTRLIGDDNTRTQFWQQLETKVLQDYPTM